MPGASRHHWGTDFDVMDLAAGPPGYRIQVVPAEYAPGGPFHRLTTWLDRHMHAFGFFRPFATDRGGVSPEPWHLSHAPVAARAQRALSVHGLRQVLAASELEGKEAVLDSLEENFRRYVVDVDRAPEAAALSPRLV
jgi:LAS superfamily LD-carboxypeptidase LdcB